MTVSNLPYSISQGNAQTPERHIDIDQFRARWTIWQTGAICGLAGGFLAGLTGLILRGITYFAAAAISEVNIIADANIISTCLTLATIPLLMLGAYCLDKIDESVRMRESVFKEKKRARFELNQKQ